MEGWTPKKIILSSLGVAVFSSALTGGIMAWLLSGQKAAPPAVFSPTALSGSSPSQAIAPLNSSEAPPLDLVQAGNWYYDRQRWSEAIQTYENALSAGFDNPDVRTDLGNCHRFSHQPEAALVQYQMAQKQDPTHEHSLYNQASLYAEEFKNAARADTVARQFIAHFPGSSNAETIKKYLLQPGS